MIVLSPKAMKTPKLSLVYTAYGGTLITESQKA